MTEESGKVAVLAAGREWSLLRIIDLGDRCVATFAIARGRRFVRTRTSLFCFGQ